MALKAAARAFAAIVLSAGAAFVYLTAWPPHCKNSEQAVITIRWGTSLRSAAEQLEDEGVIRSAEQFLLTAKLLGKSRSLRVGRFMLPKGCSNYAVLRALLYGPQQLIELTLPEGYDSRRYAGMIARSLDLDSARIMQLVHDPAFIAQLGVNSPSLEGFLYPETYHLTYGLKEEQVLSILVDQFKKRIDEALRKEAEASPLGFYGCLILASIIEGEAMVEEEMPIISSVYHNRLRRGMRLQADPTIQYLLPDGPRRLLLKDLAVPSPYNTYLHAGLPPTPINNPSRKAFEAALRPADTDYLFFVAVGDGRHTFSKTYSGHLSAKRAFDKVRRQVEREKRKKGS
ncbi:MAG: endolytic transglycosylase MltG [candidate division KSB1 bacterium]|nr:endolytic transglycosylase MltG [candidate division KSB1 bacterium]